MVHTLVKGMAFLLLAGVDLYAIEIKSPTHAVDIAGKQRMYTQRMLKDYAMIGMNNTFGNPSDDLERTIADFGDHLKSLIGYAKSDATKQKLDKIEELWVPVKEILLAAPSKESVVKLQRNLETLLNASNAATKSFAEDSGGESGKIVNTAGRQRMLSQRMASLYMLKVWGTDDPEFKRKLTDTMRSFKEAMGILEGSSLNTDEIKKFLSKTKRAFVFFEMMNRPKAKFIPTLLYRKSNVILENMNKATNAYASAKK